MKCNKKSVFMILLMFFSCADNGQTAKDTVKKWCLLNTWPENIVQDSIEVRGNSFTKEFVYHFKLKSIGDINRWIEMNSVFKFTQAIEQNEATIYRIDDSEATFCEVKIDWNKLLIEIHTYWS